MKKGRTLVELAQAIQDENQLKHDYVVGTKNIVLEQDGKHLTVRGLAVDLEATPIVHGQVAEFTKVPKPYYDRMLAEAPDLLAANVNTWLHRRDEPRMVRTLHDRGVGRARAFMSNAYRPMDNAQLLEAALPRLIDRGVEIMSCDVTETRLYLKVVDARIKKDIPTGRRLGDGSHTFFDTVSPALVLSNSEVGMGALSVETSVFTHLCTNLAVVRSRSKRTTHLGGRIDVGEDLYKLLSDDTKKLTDQALWAQIGDVVGAAFDQAQFDAVADEIAAASQDKIEADPIRVVEVTQKKFGLTDGERGSVLQHLIRGGDLTRYGLHAAITRAAEDMEDYDRASHFEKLGGKVIELPKTEWTTMTREWRQAA